MKMMKMKKFVGLNEALPLGKCKWVELVMMYIHKG
jgi:hypothetical protein